ncbi:hypothetical protein WDU94_013070 [Cyamophila willieti]
MVTRSLLDMVLYSFYLSHYRFDDVKGALHDVNQFLHLYDVRKYLDSNGPKEFVYLRAVNQFLQFDDLSQFLHMDFVNKSRMKEYCYCFPLLIHVSLLKLWLLSPSGVVYSKLNAADLVT